MADIGPYARRYWKYSARLRQLDRDGGDAEEIQDCINELSANALHAPSHELRTRSQAAINRRYVTGLASVRGI